MTNAGLRLVGILLVSNSVWGSYRVVHVYRKPLGSFRDNIHLDSGVDKAMHIDYAHIEAAIGDAYAPFVLKIWKRRAWRHFQTYFQVHTYASPHLVGLQGKWRVWAVL